MRKFTLIEDIFLSGAAHHRLRFGRAEHVIRMSKDRRLIALVSGQRFGYIRWTRNSYGTTSWLLIIGVASNAGRICTFPGVHPGAEIWFRARGKTAVKRALNWLDEVENCTKGGLESVPESFWRRAQNARELRQNLPLPHDILGEYSVLSYA